ncbi:hypothetical protein OHA74_13040 [Streptomyces phaeochromogenes]|uniref:hypothetical protein n=1 Tax=Streptomyces TaxID=1883 RepID=UPI002E2C439D|nr:hypothetical protein [Streptomyces phaeochromogenes]
MTVAQASDIPRLAGVATVVADHSWPACLADQIAAADRALDEVLGVVRLGWRRRTPDPQDLLQHVAAALRTETGLGVVLNTSALHEHRLGDILTRRDLAALVPYDNRMMLAEAASQIPATAELDGSLIVDLPDCDAEMVITTDYLARQFPAARPHPARLSEFVRTLLTGSWP